MTGRTRRPGAVMRTQVPRTRTMLAASLAVLLGIVPSASASALTEITDFKTFNARFEAGGGIVERRCSSCVSTHQNIFYKRTSALPAGKDWEKLFRVYWASSNNAIHVDFELYSSAFDMNMFHNNWTYCNYDDGGVGFPRDCGPTGKVGSQWNPLKKPVTWWMPPAKECAADYGSTKPCCGQGGVAVSTNYTCTAAWPTCTGFLLLAVGQKWGGCSGPASSPPPSVAPTSSPTKSPLIRGLRVTGWERIDMYNVPISERHCNQVCKIASQAVNQGPQSTKGNLVCRTDPLNDMNSASKGWFVDGLIMKNRGLAAYKKCKGMGSDPAAFTPFQGKNGNCEYNRKKSATCAATGGTNWIRWCCCTAPGEDVQTLCPVKTSDCTANTTWDAAGMHCTFREWTSLDRIVDVFSNVNVRDDGIDSAPLFTTTGINFGKNQLASITCSAHDPAILAVVAPSAIQFPSGGAEATMRVRGVSDRQHTHRTSKITCSILALGSTYTFTIAVNVQNVLQPSYSAICSLPKGADPMSPDLDCSETLTTNGNSSMVLVAGMCSSCPDPAFTSQTRVKIANVDVPAAVVAGSYGQRLIAKTPSIADLASAPSNFVFDKYYNISLFTPGGGGNASGFVDTSVDDATGELVCALHGLCPNRSLALSGVFYNERCESFLDPAVDKRWQLEASAPLFAYGRPPSCRPCPAGCRCPGGNRCLTAPGFYNDKESLDDKSGPMRCAVPKLKRCPGQAQNANGGSVCGDGYAGKGCELCGNGYRKESGACSKCPETNYAGAFTLPLLMNFGGAALAFPALVLLKLIFAVISRHASANDHRSCKTLLQTSFKQSALFVIAGFSSLQMVASISIAASGNMPPLMSGVNDFFKVFLFRLPLVHPACVLDFVTPFALETCVLVAGLSLALFDFSQLTRWLRLEQIVFGWHCCKKYKSLIKVRDFIRSYVTPYMRYGSSQVLVLLYIVVVKIAIEMMSCSPSKALDGKKGLTNDPSIECFTPAHSPVFTLSVVVFILVGMLWPAVWTVILFREFAASTRCRNTKSPICLTCCDVIVSQEEKKARRRGRRLAEDFSLSGHDFALDFLLEIGCTPRCGATSKRARRVKSRVKAKGKQARSYAAWVDGSTSPQYFHLIPLRLYTMLLLAIWKRLLVLPTPTMSSSIALFFLSFSTMVAFTAITVSCCPYHRSDRWNVVARVAVLFLSTTVGAANMCLSFSEIGVPNALIWVDIFATISSVALPVILSLVLVAFLLSRALGCFSKCKQCHACLSFVTTPMATEAEEEGGDEMDRDIELADKPRSSVPLAQAPPLPTRRPSARLSQVCEVLNPLDIPPPSGEPPLWEDQVTDEAWLKLPEQPPPAFDEDGEQEGDVAVSEEEASSNESAAHTVAHEYDDNEGGAALDGLDTIAGVTLVLDDLSSSEEEGEDEGDTEEVIPADDEPPPLFDLPPETNSDKSVRIGNARWKWSSNRNKKGSLAEALFKHKLAGNVFKIPRYLQQLFAQIFADADADGDGNLTTLEITIMLKKRAKGTLLYGDMHAIFTLKTLMAKQAECAHSSSRVNLMAHSADDHHGDIDKFAFAKGIMKALVKDPDGHVADWILKELQMEAAEWSEHIDTDGRTFYRHETNSTMQWKTPLIIEEMERCKALARTTSQKKSSQALLKRRAASSVTVQVQSPLAEETT